MLIINIEKKNSEEKKTPDYNAYIHSGNKLQDFTIISTNYYKDLKVFTKNKSSQLSYLVKLSFVSIRFK